MSEVKPKSGLTWRSYIGLIYTIVIFIPSQIYLVLATGSVPSGVQFFSILLLAELFRLTGGSLTIHEGIIIFIWAAGWFLPPLFVQRIQALWFRTAPVAYAFGLGGNAAPWWFAPFLDTGVWEARTFLHPAWIIPLLLPIIASTVTGFSSLGLGLLARQLYIETEQLPFPMQEMSVQAVETLVKRDKERLHILSLAALFGFIWGFVVFTLRFISVGFKIPLPLVPVPWADWNIYVEPTFPGASMGFATDITYLALGFILPVNVAIGMFIGSFSIYFVGNCLSVQYNLSMYRWWEPGMNIALSLQRSILYMWALPLIGIGLAAGLTPVFLRYKIAAEAFSAIFKRKPEAKRRFPEEFPAWMMFLPYILGAVYSTVLIAYLAPGFPIWIAATANFTLPLLLTVVSTRIVGTTGHFFVPPNFNETLIYLSGYPEADAWFTSWNWSWQSYTAGDGWCTQIYMLMRTGTSLRSSIKTWLAILPLLILFMFLITEFFWRIAKIPSELYPGANIFWPIQATYWGLWTTRPPGLFQPQLLVGSFLVMAAISIICEFIKFIPPGSAVSLAAGAVMPTPMAFPILIGVVIGKILSLVFPPIAEKYKFTVGAGLIVGQGTAIIIGVCIALISGSMWVLPY